MKLNKKQETELMQVYNAWWESYLTGDVITYDSYFDNDYRFVGSTNGEEYLNRKDTTAFFKATADQLAGKAELRNVTRSIEELEGGLILITDLADAYVISEPEWVFYSRFRFTSLLRNTKNGWRFIYQHFSAPDTKAQEGETLGIEKITNENLELRDAIKRRTVDLENKNRELEIETSLERVRAQAMSMRRSEELAAVGETVFTELKSLGFSDLRNTEIVINNDAKETILSYYYSDYGITGVVEVLYKNNPTVKVWIETMKKASDAFAKIEIAENEMDAWRKYREEVGHVPDPKLNEAKTVFYYSYSIGLGALSVSTWKPINDEQLKTLERFRNVFGLAYRRYIDVAQAEAQAREAQIELGLERVRARAMAMQKSDELSELVDTVFKELTRLDFALTWCIINIIDESSMSNTVWAANPDINKAPESYHMLFQDYPFHHAMMKGWKERKTRYVYTLEGSEKKIYDDYLFSETEFKRTPEVAQAASRALEKYVVSFSFSNFGGLQTVGDAPLSDANLDILSRFGKVFDLTYTRFNDLKLAEAQAREAQIEAALEKVRSCSLAMHTSAELGKVITVVLKNLQDLGFVLDNGAAAHLAIFSKGTRDFFQWSADAFLDAPVRVNIPYTDLPILSEFFDAKEKGADFFAKVYISEQKNAWFAYAFEHTDLKHLPGDLKQLLLASETYAHWMAIEENSALIVNSISGNQLSVTQVEILKRFAKVFEQAYIRFLDLQKAEAQTREAQIEGALEKVRSRSLAMHKSEELGEVVAVLCDMMTKLDIRCDGININIIEEGTRNFDSWLAAPGQKYAFCFHVPYFRHPVSDDIYDAIDAKKDLLTRVYSFEEKNSFFNYLYNNTDFRNLPAERKNMVLEAKSWEVSIAFAQNTALSLHSYSGIIFSNIENEILKRFATIFQQAYRRFMDLLTAEAQAKESQVQLALERIRARTMAMQHSDELQEVSTLLFQQIQQFGVEAWSCGFNIWENNGEDLHSWMCKEDGTVNPPFQITNFKENPRYIHSYEAWKKGEPFYWDELQGEEMEAFYRYLRSVPIINYVLEMNAQAGFTLPESQVHHVANFSHGYLMFITYKPHPEVHDIFKRFAQVFDQTYIRFLDLKKAEAQAREAMIEASLERVRSRAMAMHSSQDLADTIVAFYHELELFSITPRRCGVGLINKATHIAELSTMNTTEQGKSIEIIGKIKLAGHPVLEGVYDNWILQKEYHPVLRGNEIKDYYELIRPQIQFPEYPNDVVQYGYFFYFPEGGVYAWMDKEMADDELKIYRRFTSVLSLTYKRYKDLQQAEELAQQAELDLVKLKEEKRKTEDALTELKITQSQLIQSEKMASLGELTAGIAHEIQNPLNFVNNFSEVSNELIDEMMEEVAKGNYEDAKAIAEDVKQNLEKINHHGKRADGIVKGMLQHSRSSSATTEPTDINKLADEYLRLAYHGLRAKDKSFNATLKTDYDDSIGNIDIIPQDIGRAILNLITNAFYAVAERKKQGRDGYEPTVLVSTKKNGDIVSVTVTDNGKGIPQKVVDKIFQPFFTTKPTGQGTGLGLSLAYDIVKAHGGELKVETKEEEGAEFIIQLPMQQ